MGEPAGSAGVPPCPETSSGSAKAVARAPGSKRGAPTAPPPFPAWGPSPAPAPHHSMLPASPGAALAPRAATHIPHPATATPAEGPPQRDAPGGSFRKHLAPSPEHRLVWRVGRWIDRQTDRATSSSHRTLHCHGSVMTQGGPRDTRIWAASQPLWRLWETLRGAGIGDGEWQRDPPRGRLGQGSRRWTVTPLRKLQPLRASCSGLSSRVGPVRIGRETALVNTRRSASSSRRAALCVPAACRGWPGLVAKFPSQLPIMAARFQHRCHHSWQPRLSPGQRGDYKTNPKVSPPPSHRWGRTGQHSCGTSGLPVPALSHPLGGEIYHPPKIRLGMGNGGDGNCWDRKPPRGCGAIMEEGHGRGGGTPSLRPPG